MECIASINQGQDVKEEAVGKSEPWRGFRNGSHPEFRGLEPFTLQTVLGLPASSGQLVRMKADAMPGLQSLDFQFRPMHCLPPLTVLIFEEDPVPRLPG